MSITAKNVVLCAVGAGSVEAADNSSAITKGVILGITPPAFPKCVAAKR